MFDADPDDYGLTLTVDTDEWCAVHGCPDTWVWPGVETAEDLALRDRVFRLMDQMDQMDQEDQTSTPGDYTFAGRPKPKPK